MPRTSADPKAETVTFRISPALKAAIAEIAKPVGELLRELVSDRVRRQRRREFEAEARRQSRELAIAAQDPNSDEAAILRELDANFDQFAREWK
jgi:hypothetical protein